MILGLDMVEKTTGHGPENITALRRFAIGVIHANSRDTVAATIQRDGRMTDNSRRRQPSLQMQAG